MEKDKQFVQRGAIYRIIRRGVNQAVYQITQLKVTRSGLQDGAKQRNQIFLNALNKTRIDCNKNSLLLTFKIGH